MTANSNLSERDHLFVYIFTIVVDQDSKREGRGGKVAARRSIIKVDITFRLHQRSIRHRCDNWSPSRQEASMGSNAK
eukprot:scaffold4226_cov99-Skeletonema_dohrnii-CCMP3373.AAC.3